MFQTALILRPLNGGRRWLVVQDFDFLSPSVGPISVPAGFITDLNSIPRPWWVVSPPTDFPEAGVVHDYLYASQFPRDKADKVYAEALTASGMDRARVQARYIALRAFGWKAYRSHAKGGSLEHQ